MPVKKSPKPYLFKQGGKAHSKTSQIGICRVIGQWEGENILSIPRDSSGRATNGLEDSSEELFITDKNGW